MNADRDPDSVAERAVAFVDSLEVPAIDPARITARRRVCRTAGRRSRVSRRTAAIGAVLAALLVSFALAYAPTVVADVQCAFAAFSISAHGPAPATVNVVDLKRARAEMPFTVIVPPAIAGLPNVTIDELRATSSGSEATLIFDFRGMAPGSDVLIIESQARGGRRPMLFALPDSAQALAVPRPSSFAGLASRDRQPMLVRYLTPADPGSRPESWVVHGTRVAVLCPAASLSATQLRAIKRSMSSDP